MGDPIKLLMLDKVLDVVDREQMMEKAVTTGDYLLCELNKLQSLYPNFFSKARGRGLFAAIDVKWRYREDFIQKLLKRGKFFETISTVCSLVSNLRGMVLNVLVIFSLFSQQLH